MQSVRRRIRSFAWLALVAIAGWLIVPAASRALSLAGDTGPWAEVCSVAGVSSAAASGGSGEPSGGGTVHPMDHCPLCGQSSDAPVLPTPDAVWPLARGNAALMPGLFRDAPRPLFAWAPAQARAPPARG